MLQAHLISVDDALWRAVLAEVEHDVYHLPAYGQVEAHRMGAEAAAVIARRGRSTFLLPLLLRPVPAVLGGDGLRDAISPYGYAGPLVITESDWPASLVEKFMSEALQATIDTLRKQSVIAALVRFHPLLPTPLAPFSQTGELIGHGRTVTIDLTQDPEQRWKHLRENHRRDIVAARRAGCSVEIGPPAIEEFRTLYEATMTRVEAETDYFFSAAYYERLLSQGEFEARVAVARLGTQPLATALFLRKGRFAHYHLGGTEIDGPVKGGLKLILWEAGAHFAAHGATALHLGGGRGAAEDGLFRFKAGFSKQFAPFFTWRHVVDPAAYAALRTRTADLLKVDHVNGSFFPCYRLIERDQGRSRHDRASGR